MNNEAVTKEFTENKNNLRVHILLVFISDAG